MMYPGRGKEINPLKELTMTAKNTTTKYIIKSAHGDEVWTGCSWIPATMAKHAKHYNTYLGAQREINFHVNKAGHWLVCAQEVVAVEVQ